MKKLLMGILLIGMSLMVSGCALFQNLNLSEEQQEASIRTLGRSLAIILKNVDPVAFADAKLYCATFDEVNVDNAQELVDKALQYLVPQYFGNEELLAAIKDVLIIMGLPYGEIQTVVTKGEEGKNLVGSIEVADEVIWKVKLILDGFCSMT